MLKLSDYVVKFLEDIGVNQVFILGGGGCMHLLDSFGRSKKINYTCVHHEQAAAMAAEAYSKLTNELSVVLVTSGPGSTNTLTGVLGAYLDSVPCMIISGQSKVKQTVYDADIKGLRQFGTQETNIIPIVESITKCAEFVSDPKMIKYQLKKCVYEATTGRPGPVWLDVPIDIQSCQINELDLRSYEIEEELEYEFCESDINYIIESIKNAERPVIIAGHGIRLSDCRDQLKKLVEEYKIPVVTSIMGIDVLPTEHFNNIGRIGIRGTRAGNFALQNADLVISVGCRLAVPTVGHEYELFARAAKIIVVDIDEVEHKKKTIKIDRFIKLDAKIFLEKFYDLMKGLKDEIKEYNTWISYCDKLKHKYPVCLSSYDNDKNGINYYKLVDSVSKRMNDDAIIISDAGSSFYIVSQGVSVKEKQRYITSGAIATMGFSLPASIGIAVDNLERQVVAITGDGSLQQNIQELATIKGMNLNIKMFIANNNGYYSIMHMQRRFFPDNYVGESEKSGLYFPKLSKIAEAYEIEYLYIDNISELSNKLEYIFTSKNPMIIEVRIDSEQIVSPVNAPKMMPDGKIVSAPLEDMYPFLSREEFKENMIVTPLDSTY